MALKRADDSACISVIDTSKINPKSIYHVPPFYAGKTETVVCLHANTKTLTDICYYIELKKKRVFFKGGFIYKGSHEQ
jgi:hypothetical protein